MTKSISNVGQYGVKSIRLNGTTIDNLPIAESARVKMQLPIAEENERQQLIKDIKARYPTQDVHYLKARIQEARSNIAKFREQAIRIGSSRGEYELLLRDARIRDKKIKEATERLRGDELEAKVKELTSEYGPWQVEGLEKQIKQFTVSIEKFEDTIKVEQNSIDELSELLGQCKARDKELTRLGA